MNPVVILDRDGVINEESDDFIKSPEEWHPIPGSMEAISRLTEAGCRIVVVSNQSGLARGLFSIGDLNRIHERMVRTATERGGMIEAVFFCPHGPDDGCECRKPRPGMLRQIMERLGAPATLCWFVGDRLTDVEAARRAGIHPVLVQSGKPLPAPPPADVPVYPDLAAFTDDFLARRGREE